MDVRMCLSCGLGREGETIPGSKVDLKQQNQGSTTFPLATLK